MKQKEISSSSSNSSTIHKHKYSQPTYTNNGGGVASIMLSCCAPELRASPTNIETEGGNTRGRRNVWSEKEFGKTYNRQGTSDVQKRQFPLLGCHAEGGQHGRPPKPFASNPLLDRDDSLVHEGSLMSLVASDCETRRSYDEDAPSTPQFAFRQERRPKPFESSPLIGRDDSLLQGGSLLSLIASQDETLNHEEEVVVPSTPQVSYAKYNARLLETPSGDASSVCLTPLQPPPSPAFELSMARQQASQMMGKLNMRRELSRGSLFPKVDSVMNSSSVAKNMKDLLLHSQPAEEKSVVSGHQSVSSHSVSVYDSLKVSPPIWKGDDCIHPELKFTYRYPRLFADDPINVIGQSEMPWWYRLSKQLDTTLSHVFDSRWQELEMQQQKECGTHNNSADTINSESGQLALTDNIPCSPDAIVDLCSNNTPPRLRQLPQQNHSSSSLNNSLLEKLSDISPINAWSEPEASTMKIRGVSYAKDGIKVESDTALFACVGVDSFVSGENGSKEYSNTTHYLERWKRVCGEAGLENVPFLLVINFVVPWGNFQSYSFRPDADDGPFSSKYRGRPSEQAWRAFVEGDTEYRNKYLKLIPRVCAGPWVVKKMVGSTPALIGTKLPVTYRGSVDENFLEITMDVTKGPAFGNTVANTVVGKADLVTVDLGFVIEGQEDNGTLPEQMLSLIRLHHLEMKKANTIMQWREKVDEMQEKRR